MTTKRKRNNKIMIKTKLNIKNLSHSNNKKNTLQIPKIQKKRKRKGMNNNYYRHHQVKTFRWQQVVTARKFFFRKNNRNSNNYNKFNNKMNKLLKVMSKTMISKSIMFKSITNQILNNNNNNHHNNNQQTQQIYRQIQALNYQIIRIIIKI